MVRKSAKADLFDHPRNQSLLDIWSLIHFVNGILLGWIFGPVIAIAVMVLWEPFEVYVLSPFLAKWKIEFGYENWQNTVSDIVVDVLGVLVGVYLLGRYLPFLG